MTVFVSRTGLRRAAVTALLSLGASLTFSFSPAGVAAPATGTKGAAGGSAMPRHVVPSERVIKMGPPRRVTIPFKTTARAAADPSHNSSKRVFTVLQTAPSSSAGTTSAPAVATSASSAPSTSFLNTTFLGINNTGPIPPDPTIAAGPLNLLVVANGGVAMFDKSGVTLGFQDLTSFFSMGKLSLANDGPRGAFDPWAAYDPYIGRFWLIAISENDSAKRSTLLIAVSNTNDATGAWTFQQLPADLNGNSSSGFWCDYEKVGFDAQAIYITCNMFAFPSLATSTQGAGSFQYAKVKVMTKGQFLANPCCYWWDFWGLSESTPCQNFFAFACAKAVQPARMYGAVNSDGEYLIAADGQGGSGSGVEVWKVTNPQTCCTPGNQSAPNMQQVSYGVTGYGKPNGGRQSGTSTLINTDDTGLLFAIWQSGLLSTGQNLGCNGGTCFGIIELDVSSFPTISTVNDAMTGPGSIDRYYPHLDVTASGFKTVTFTESSSSTFAGAFIQDIPARAACTNCTLPEVSIQPGLASYTLDRWGDYSGASHDPDGRDIWLHAEFAGTNNRWQTQVASSSPETWIQKNPSTVPPARQLQAMAYDAGRKRVVMFGGTNASSGALASGALGDTWTWNGSNWTKMNPSTSPGARFGSGMAYDAQLGKVVLFGGSNQGNAFLNDTWTWDGSNWSPLFPSTTPPAAPSASLAYDVATSSDVLYEVPAGQKGNPPLAQTWNFNGSNWSMASVTNPPYRSWPGMSYDRGNGVVVLFGGEQVAKGGAITYLNDTWTWNGSGWTQQGQTGAPSPRALMSMDYDTTLGFTVMTSGFNGALLNDTWWWDGTSWAVQHPGSSLSPSRQASGMVFFPPTSLVTLFGGDNSTPSALSDTWVY